MTHLHLTTVGSTNAVCLERAGRDPVDWVTADTQTAGRGRRGREWASPVGNLYASALHRTSVDGDDAFAVLPFSAALSLFDAIVARAPQAASRLALKWPNDLLLDGLKVSGILLEARVEADQRSVAIGFGVNCSAHPSTGIVAATDFSAAGIELEPADLFVALARALHARLARAGESDYTARTIAEWRQRSHGIGQPIIVRLPTRELHGTFHDLAPDGCLILEKSDGRMEHIAAGDVFFDHSQGPDMNARPNKREATA